MIELFSYSLSIYEFAILVIAAVLVGMAKAGIAGAGMIAVPLIAIPFGGKSSTGLLLPILIFADVFAVAYYHQHANWFHLKRLLPFAFVGVLMGTYIGDVINEATFKAIMVVIIFLSLAIMVWREKNTSIMALYLLAMRLPKAEFIGTAAWFFLIINLSKVPFHVAVWHTISMNTVLLCTTLIPAVGLGVYCGVTFIKRINEKNFRYFVIGMTAVTAVAMIV